MSRRQPACQRPEVRGRNRTWSEKLGCQRIFWQNTLDIGRETGLQYFLEQGAFKAEGSRAIGRLMGEGDFRIHFFAQVEPWILHPEPADENDQLLRSWNCWWSSPSSDF